MAATEFDAVGSVDGDPLFVLRKIDDEGTLRLRPLRGARGGRRVSRVPLDPAGVD